ncbi:MAG: hypothetical protein LAN71_17485 [Acidobacteriia bacterium]|nr:hypothetical protein [Terriglobia bacterium]
MTLDVPEIPRFRSVVNAIPIPYWRDKVLLEALYLTASREAELSTQTIPWDLLHKRTKPYGLYLTFGIKDFEMAPARDHEPAKIEKILVIQEACAKRMKGKKKLADDTELTVEETANYLPQQLREGYVKNPASVDPLIVKSFLGELSLKSIALPCNPVFEPWTHDLLKIISKTGTLSFKLTRFRMWQIQRQWLSSLLKPKNKRNERNPLRHFRLTHLAGEYDFNAYDISVYSGWTMGTTAGMFGIQSSNQIGQYVHLKWKDYLPKLLKPISDFE